MIGFAAGMEMADMAWEVKCREEDMKQRALENERHAIDDARRSVDEKAQQLQVLANQSALIAGFSMVVLVESSIPEDIDGVILTLFGGFTACVIALMLVSTLNATYVLVAILRYDCVNREVPFDVFWRKRCEPDWKLALRTFSYGIPLFMITVSLVAWVSFWNHKSVFYSASVVTAISVMGLVYWFGNTKRKWGDFLMMSDARLVSRTMSNHGDSESRNSFPGKIEGTSGECDNSDGDVSDLEPKSEFAKDNIVTYDFKSS
mmetsp:Transcript_8245/g.17581  ORF Transcript_8245/g.17581 Transcript_8245/m.17581 type:complete len:261 (-) Transcript_8245:141-923(-)